MRVELVKLVAKYAPQDLHVFYKYFNSNILQWRNHAEFEQLVKLVTCFAEQGMIDSESKIVEVMN